MGFTPDSRSFCTWGDQDAFLRVWDVATGKAIREFAIEPSDVKPTKSREKSDVEPFGWGRWNDNISDARFSPDARWFAISWMRSVYFFDVATGKEIQKLPADARMRPFAISPDRKRLATAVVAAKPMEQRLASGGVRFGLPNETNLSRCSKIT